MSGAFKSIQLPTWIRWLLTGFPIQLVHLIQRSIAIFSLVFGFVGSSDWDYDRAKVHEIDGFSIRWKIRQSVDV